MIDLILPAAVASAELFHDPEDAELFPEEEVVVATASPKRRKEFTSARLCARRALHELGVRAAAIVPARSGAPGWPADVVGSMTHCAGYRAAAVGRTGEFRSIGIDAEPAGPLTDGVLAAIGLPAERRALAGLAARHPEVPWDRLLFSAKESIYKAWFPLTGRWLGFDEATVHIEPATGRFTASLLVEGPPELRDLTGRWLFRDGFVLTSVTVGRPPPEPAVNTR